LFSLYIQGIRGQGFPKAGSRSLQTRLHCAHFDIQDLSDLTQWNLLVVGKYQHLSLHLRQHQNGLPNNFFDLGPSCSGEGALCNSGMFWSSFVPQPFEELIPNHAK